MMNFKTINISILVSIFLLSVLVRVPVLSKHMGRHHEFITGHVLVVNSNFENDDALNRHCSPVWTFNNTADKHAHAKLDFKDQDSSHYYVSYPPATFLIPYLVLKPFGGTSVGGIRTIGLVNHFFCGFFIFLIINACFGVNIREKVFAPAIAAFVVYTFAAGNLWFHANTYFADMQVHLFVLAFLYVFILFLRKEILVKKASLWFGLLAFLGVYTEWIMLFVAFFVFCFFVFKAFKKSENWQIVFFIGLGVFSALVLTLIQYSSISGVADLFNTLEFKYKQRSGMVEGFAEYGFSYASENPFKRLLEHYETNYGETGLLVTIHLIILAFLASFVTKQKQWSKYFHILALLALVLSVILIHHFVFFNFTLVHDFSSLKTSIFYSLFVAFVAAILFDFIKEKVAKKKWLYISYSLLLLVFVALSTQEYLEVNNDDKLSYDTYKFGTLIKEYIPKDELVCSPYGTTPEAWYYAQRNVQYTVDLNEAKAKLCYIHYNKAAFIEVKDNGYTVTKIDSLGNKRSEEYFTYRSK